MDDLISRADAIALAEEVENKRLKGEIDLTYAPMIKGIKALPSAQQNCDGCKWLDAIGYGECHHCKRAFEDMYEKGEQP